MTLSVQTSFICCWPTRRPSRDTSPASSEALGPSDLFVPATRVVLAHSSLREMVISHLSHRAIANTCRPFTVSPSVAPLHLASPGGGPSPAERKKPPQVGEGPEEEIACACLVQSHQQKDGRRIVDTLVLRRQSIGGRRHQPAEETRAPRQHAWRRLSPGKSQKEVERETEAWARLGADAPVRPSCSGRCAVQTH